MHFASKTIALAAAATLIRAAPTTNITQLEHVDDATSTNVTERPIAQGWAVFCDDDNCSENCGMAVSLNNPGCLREPHRKSVKFHGKIYWSHFNLIVSPDDQCSCQSNCADGIAGDSSHCMSLEPFQGGSYRFITAEMCNMDNNNC